MEKETLERLEGLAELSLPGFDDEFIVSRHRLDPQFFHRAVGRSGKLDFSPAPARRRDKFGGSSGTVEDPEGPRDQQDACRREEQDSLFHFR